jgi:hypothetical protein
VQPSPHRRWIGHVGDGWGAGQRIEASVVAADDFVSIECRKCGMRDGTLVEIVEALRAAKSPKAHVVALRKGDPPLPSAKV